MLIRHGAQVQAYLNECPHTGAPLDWSPGRFLTVDRKLIQCAMHGAQFRPEDGYCVAGPCAGDQLSAMPIQIVDEVVYLD